MRTFWLSSIVSVTLLVAGCGSTVQVEDSATDSTPAEAPETVTETAPAAATATDTPSEATPVTESVEADVAQATLAAVYAQNGIAIAGADPVAYFTESTYVPGSDQFTYDWSGTTWQFASAENRDLFASNPNQYAPQYGGFCAWAVSQGYTAPVDPTAWKIVDNRLYLNYDRKVQARWEQDVPGNIAKADANWPAVAE